MHKLREKLSEYATSVHRQIIEELCVAFVIFVMYYYRLCVWYWIKCHANIGPQEGCLEYFDI